MTITPNAQAIRLACATTLATVIFTAPALAGRQWQEVDVPDGSMMVSLPDGSTRVVRPSCAGGPRMGPSGVESADTDFKFFVREGNPNRVLFFMDGGGACWDATTCIGSALTGQSTYTQEINETASALDGAGGIFDRRDPDNPYANYTAVFIPYCTADIHWASKDTTYNLPTGPDSSITSTLRHRGADNFLAALHMLNTDVTRKNGRPLVDLASARDITVTGSSAGGYGATLAYPYVAEFAHAARRINLISDAAVGVLTEDFFTSVIHDATTPGSSSWAIANNLPAWVPAFQNPDVFLSQAAAQTTPVAGLPGTNLILGFQPALFSALSEYRPQDRLASITTNADTTQVRFFAASLPSTSAGAGGTSAEPQNELALFQQVTGLWYSAAAAMLELTTATPNYRYFMESGACHTFLSDQSCSLYEPGSNGLSIADWITKMIKPGNRRWRNEDAGAPVLLLEASR